MSEKKMTLIERLRNPAWVYDGDHVRLHEKVTRDAMTEAADLIARVPTKVGVPDEKQPEPLRFDSTPRFIEPAVSMSPGESALWEALRNLRVMAHARGYNNRQVEFADCIFVHSERWAMKAAELAEKFPGLRTQSVTPAILKTEAAWALVIGVDSFVSCPSW